MTENPRVEKFNALLEDMQNEFGIIHHGAWPDILRIRDQIQRENGNFTGEDRNHDYDALFKAREIYTKKYCQMQGAEEYEFIIASAEVMEGLK